MNKFIKYSLYITTTVLSLFMGSAVYASANFEGVATFGSGTISLPLYVTTDVSGNVYVSDWGNDRGRRYDPDGNLLGTYGTDVSNERIHLPYGNHVYNGKFYICDINDKTVKVFDLETYEFLEELTFASAIYDIEISIDGNLLFLDRANKKILEYDSDHNFVRNIPASGSLSGHVGEAQNMSVDASGNILIGSAAYNEDIYRYDKDGNNIGKLDFTNGGGNGEFRRNYTALTLEGGHYLIAENGHSSYRSRVQLISNELDYIASVGYNVGSKSVTDNSITDLSTENVFNAPQDIAVFGNRLYIADSYNNRIQVVTLPDGYEAAAAADITGPAAPSSFSASHSVNDIALSWTNPTDVDFDSITLRRSTTDYPTSASAGDLVTENITSTSYADTDLADGTYYYSLFAKDTSGNFSAKATANATIDTTAPSAPTSFSADVSGDTVSLSWTNPETDFHSVMVRRGTSAAPSSISDGTLVTQNATTTTVSDSSLEDGTYFYSLFARDNEGNYASAVTLSATVDTVSPIAPTSFNASDSGDSITLSWTNPTDDFHSVMIRRGTSSAPSSITDGTLVTQNSTATSITDTSLDDGTYYYSLFARDEAENYSSSVTASATIDTTAPSAISSLSISNSADSAILTWTNPSEDFNSVMIRRNTSAAPTSTSDGTLVAQNITDTTFTDESLEDGTYYYAVFARDDNANYSSSVTSSVEIDATGPDSPGSFASDVDDTTVTLTWSNPTNDDFHSVMIRRSTSSAPTSISEGDLVSAVETTETYVDESLTPATYYYAIFARDTNGNYSSPATVTVILDVTPPSAVSGSTIAVSDSSTTLQWTNPTDDDFHSVMIRRSTTAAPSSISDGTLVAQNVTDTSYTETELDDATYYYSIFARDIAGNYSSSASVSGEVDTTAPDAVSGLDISASDDDVTLTWTNPTNDDFSGVMIRKSTTAAPTSITDGTLVIDDLTDTTYSDSSLSDAVYYYSVFSKDDHDNYSAASSVSERVDTGVSAVSNVDIDVESDQITLTWDNPEESDFSHVVIRYSTSETPESISDGTAVTENATGTSITFTRPDDSALFFSLFAIDDIDNVSDPASVSIEEVSGPLLKSRPLNYPNPVKLSTTSTRVEYFLNKSTDNIELRVYLNGRLLYSEFMNGTTGYNNFVITSAKLGGSVSAGMYPYLLIHEGEVIGKGRIGVLP